MCVTLSLHLADITCKETRYAKIDLQDQVHNPHSEIGLLAVIFIICIVSPCSDCRRQ